MRKGILSLVLSLCVSSCSSIPAFINEDDEMPSGNSFENRREQVEARFASWYDPLAGNQNNLRPAEASALDLVTNNPLRKIADAGTLAYTEKISFEAPEKAEPRLPAGCSIRDRFDRNGVLAYNFSNQSRLSLHMDVDAKLMSVDVDEVMVKFRYKFQDMKNRKEKCFYPAGFQGLGGSIYNEFFMRKKDTVMDELMDKNPLGLFD